MLDLAGVDGDHRAWLSDARSDILLNRLPFVPCGFRSGGIIFLDRDGTSVVRQVVPKTGVLAGMAEKLVIDDPGIPLARTFDVALCSS